MSGVSPFKYLYTVEVNTRERQDSLLSADEFLKQIFIEAGQQGGGGEGWGRRGLQVILHHAGKVAWSNWLGQVRVKYPGLCS